MSEEKNNGDWSSEMSEKYTSEDRLSDPKEQKKFHNTKKIKLHTIKKIIIKKDKKIKIQNIKKSHTQNIIKNILKSKIDEPVSFKKALKKGFRETIDTFKALAKAPREIIGVNIVNVIEGMAYFGILTYLVIYMHENVGLSDTASSWVVTIFMALVTVSQLLFGGLSDTLGAVKSLGISLVILAICRLALGFSEPVFAGTGAGIGANPFFISVAVALAFSALAYGLYQPAIYSVTRQYSDKKTSAVSYAMLYAGMNLGAFVIGLILPWVRRTSSEMDILKIEGTNNNGISGSLIFLGGMVVIALICYFFFISLSKNKPLEDPNEKKEKEDEKDANKPLSTRIVEYLSKHPLRDKRFTYFIFILIPVQTLFAYQNILIPTYLTRCFKEFPTISDNYETFSNLNPLIVFVAAPIIAALTARSDVYKMMIIGTIVMAAPTFLLTFGQTPVTFLAFVLIMSIGESMWQPRFLQHVAEIAPKNRVGAYIGIAQLPWFLTKLIVGSYVGFFMENFIPENGYQSPELMWGFFAVIAMISPFGLILARNWCNIKKAAN